MRRRERREEEEEERGGGGRGERRRRKEGKAGEEENEENEEPRGEGLAHTKYLVTTLIVSSSKMLLHGPGMLNCTRMRSTELCYSCPYRTFSLSFHSAATVSASTHNRCQPLPPELASLGAAVLFLH